MLELSKLLSHEFILNGGNVAYYDTTYQTQQLVESMLAMMMMAMGVGMMRPVMLQERQKAYLLSHKSNNWVETAHSVDTLNALMSIAREGLRPGSSIENAVQRVYATGTYRIIFSGKPIGTEMARSFAPEFPFLKTHEMLTPDRIIRIEVDILNLTKKVPTDEELAKIYEEAVARYGEDNIPSSWWKKTGRLMDMNWEVYHEGRKIITQQNYKEMIRDALKGTAAASVPIVPLYLTE